MTTLLGVGVLFAGALAWLMQEPARSAADDERTGERRPHPELGLVRWRRGYDAARREAIKQGKPLFVLFDEVPGCSTVRHYGSTVLTHPLIVDALEEETVPVWIKNNAGPTADDTRVLRRFREPAWNNPVVRILDPGTERPLTPRLDGDYTVRATAQRIEQALKNHQRSVPGFLKLLIEEEAFKKSRLETARLSMYCFWSGEVALGAIEGVASTRPAHLAGREIVELQYDPRRVSFRSILRRARTERAADRIFALNRRQRSVAEQLGIDVVDTHRRVRDAPRDDKYQLRHSSYRNVPMTPLQQMKVNADLGRRQNPARWLSRRQQKLARRR